ncbi:MAG: hypothetical protein QFF03_17350, partial [Pseudomonadota bacterium]|nr:hypothetical protein [Pseudomonadota bacterium]
VRSHLGQPLSADIELTGIANEAASVQVALADIEVYRGASISMHPALASLNITIVRRDGKRILHLASPKPVDAEFIHIFFDLNENGRRAVRQATLWFTPDPNPPAPKAAAPAPVVVPAAVPVHAPVPVPVVAPVAARAPAAALPRVVAAAPFDAPMLRAVPAAKPVACVQQFTVAQIDTCAALDAKNAALSAQIVDLEEKVRRLSAAMHAVAAQPVAAATPAPAAHTPAPAPAHAPEHATPWLFIGLASAVVLALIGVLLYLLQRKRKAVLMKAGGQPGPGLIAKVKKRLMPGKKDAEPAA